MWHVCEHDLDAGRYVPCGSAFELVEHLLATQHPDRYDALAICGCDRQGRQRDFSGEPGVDDWIVPIKADHVGHQRCDLPASVIADVVVDVPGQGSKQWVRARRVVGPGLAGKEGDELHKAGTLAWVPVLASRQDRDQVR
jgi:hypothetical protein